MERTGGCPVGGGDVADEGSSAIAESDGMLLEGIGMGEGIDRLG